MTQLNIDDELYYKRHDGKPVYSGKVLRVTATQAEIEKPYGNGRTKVRRDARGGFAYDEIGGSRGTFYLLTDDVISQIKYNEFREQHEKIIANYFSGNPYQSVKNLPDDALVKISEIIGNQVT